MCQQIFTFSFAVFFFSHYIIPGFLRFFNFLYKKSRYLFGYRDFLCSSTLRCGGSSDSAKTSTKVIQHIRFNHLAVWGWFRQLCPTCRRSTTCGVSITSRCGGGSDQIPDELVGLAITAKFQSPRGVGVVQTRLIELKGKT